MEIVISIVSIKHEYVRPRMYVLGGDPIGFKITSKVVYNAKINGLQLETTTDHIDVESHDMDPAVVVPLILDEIQRIQAARLKINLELRRYNAALRQYMDAR